MTTSEIAPTGPAQAASRARRPGTGRGGRGHHSQNNRDRSRPRSLDGIAASDREVCAMTERFLVQRWRARWPASIRPAGNKNAALPIVAATLLADGPVELSNVPRIRDVEALLATPRAPRRLGGVDRAQRRAGRRPQPCRTAPSIPGSAPGSAPRSCWPGRCSRASARSSCRRRAATSSGGGGSIPTSSRWNSSAPPCSVGRPLRDRGPPPRRRRHLPRRAQRHRHRERPDGGRDGPRADGAAQRRQRAARAGPGADPGRHGRADRGHRHQHLRHRRRPGAARRAPTRSDRTTSRSAASSGSPR